ncbi:MAG: ammonia-forming cytochrome c nitrite reductase subunit c552 [Chlorobi bacterium]|nr:ammonia-forming cytochrome c nitrite reductase subunit c552 [Chlorobiota bacterium]
MNKFLKSFLFSFVLIIIMPELNFAQSTLDCSACHSEENTFWLLSSHANTQNDVAEELAGEWAGLPPDSVILGQDAEDCIACHGASAIAANSGMTEVQAMEYFFSLTDGLYTSSTQALNTDEWPHNACVTCHNVPADHPTSMPTLSIFNSPTAQYNSITNSSMLCGQCHGTLRYADTDHRRMNAWKMSLHGHGGQNDVADELAGEFAGSTPAEVAAEENCIACHAPTAVMNNTLTEAQALDNFFTTTNGTFSSATEPQDTINFPQVACIACHNPHHPEEISYFNSSTKEYEIMSSSQELCGQCHGDLRFPDTDHLSYNIEEGTGGMGVSDQVTMAGVKCVDCHMNTSEEEGTNASMFGGHSWEVFVTEEDGSITSSCTECHSTMTATAAMDSVDAWKVEFENLDLAANQKIGIADSILENSTDSAQILKLEKAKYNVGFAESDESGGVHNHLYTKALLQDAIDKANQIITGINDLTINENIFELHQNYPNPFSISTNISYTIPKAANISVDIYNMKGQHIETLLKDKYENKGTHTITFNSANLPSGIYFCSLVTGKTERIMKMILLRK